MRSIHRQPTADSRNVIASRSKILRSLSSFAYAVTVFPFAEIFTHSGSFSAAASITSRCCIWFFSTTILSGHPATHMPRQNKRTNRPSNLRGQRSAVCEMAYTSGVRNLLTDLRSSPLWSFSSVKKRRRRRQRSQPHRCCWCTRRSLRRSLRSLEIRD